MNEIIISPLTKKLVVRFSGKRVVLPAEIQQKIDAYWNKLMVSGKTYTRGEVFTVTRKEAFENRIEVLVEKTDYAHNLYSQNIGGLGEHGVCIIHTAALVETADRKTIFGKMGSHTARAEIYQLCGGGIDNDDLRGDVFDFDHNIQKELREELGIDVGDKQRIKAFELAYFKEGGPADKMTVVYRVVLNETSEEFMKKYNSFVSRLQENGEVPEFDEIVVLDENSKALIDFLRQPGISLCEYMKPLFEFIGKE